MKDKRGIALILAVGIVALLAVIATSFALNMRLEYKAARNYYNTVMANYFAEAALERAISGLKTDVRMNAFDDLTEGWAATGYQNDIDGDGTNDTTSNILDEQRKVNINTGNQQLLENLFTELGIPDPATLYATINGSRPYRHLQELISIADITEGEYGTIVGDITLFTYEDPNTNRSPVNVNTCSVELLRAVLNGLNDGTYSISSADAANVADDIINGSTSAPLAKRPFSSWADFEACLDGSVADTTITSDQATLIMNNCNPNMIKPAVVYTTEFCFNSGGYYEITGTGDVIIGGVPIAQRAVGTVVKIYDIYNETTKAQFALGTPVRVTWFDDCPIDDTDWYGSAILPPPSSYARVPNSLKIGFFDNFDEDPAFSNAEWTGNAHTIGDIDGDGDNEMYSASFRWPNFRLSDSAKWAWTYSTIRIEEQDLNWEWQWKDTGWVQCNGTSILLARNLSPLGWSGSFYYRNIAGVCSYSSDAGYPYWNFPSRLARLPGTVYGDGTMPYTSDHPYTNKKTFNMRHRSSGFGATVYNGAGSTSITYPSGGSSVLNLYGNANKPAWDDVRIIPSDGNYTSVTYMPIGAGDNVNWGTMAFTGTLQTGTTISTDADTGSGFFVVNPIGTNGGSIGGTSDSIQYRVNLTSDSNMRNTPIVEDITITYLPATQILAWTK